MADAKKIELESHLKTHRESYIGYKRLLAESEAHVAFQPDTSDGLRAGITQALEFSKLIRSTFTDLTLNADELQEMSDEFWTILQADDTTKSSSANAKKDRLAHTESFCTINGLGTENLKNSIREKMTRSIGILSKYVKDSNSLMGIMDGIDYVAANSTCLSKIRSADERLREYEILNTEQVLLLTNEATVLCLKSCKSIEHFVKTEAGPFFDELHSKGFGGLAYEEHPQFPAIEYRNFKDIKTRLSFLLPLIDLPAAGGTSVGIDLARVDPLISQTFTSPKGSSPRTSVPKIHAMVSPPMVSRSVSKIDKSSPILPSRRTSTMELTAGYYRRRLPAVVHSNNSILGEVSADATHAAGAGARSRPGVHGVDSGGSDNASIPFRSIYPKINDHPEFATLQSRQDHNRATRVVASLPGAPRYKNIKLPLIEPPTFSGMKADYPSFKREFRALFETAIENEDYLAKYLISAVGFSSHAGRLIRMVNAMPGCYDTMWNILDEEFGNQQATFAGIVAKLEGINKKIGENDKHALIAFAEQVQTFFAKLHDLDPRWCNMVPMLSVSKLVDCLPRLDQISWLVELQAMNEDEQMHPFPFFVDFLMELRSQMKRLTIFDKMDLPNPPKKDDTKKKDDAKSSHHLKTGGKGNDKSDIKKKDGYAQLCLLFPCQICKTGKGSNKKADHVLWKCDEFRKKSPENRRKYTLSEKLCTICLRPFVKQTHKCPFFCQSATFPCQETACTGDGKKHSKMLSCNTNCVMLSSHNLLTSRVSMSAVMLAPLAPEYCKPGTSQDICAFFDEGSDSSFIMERFAKNCRLKKVGVEKISIRTLNNSIMSINSTLYLVPFLANDDVYYVHAYSINQYITSRVRQLDLVYLSQVLPDHIDLLPSLQRDITRPVEILMGLDCFGLHPRLTIGESKDRNIQIVQGPLGTTVVGSYQCAQASPRSFCVSRVMKLQVTRTPLIDTKHTLAGPSVFNTHVQVFQTGKLATSKEGMSVMSNDLPIPAPLGILKGGCPRTDSTFDLSITSAGVDSQPLNPQLGTSHQSIQTPLPTSSKSVHFSEPALSLQPGKLDESTFIRDWILGEDLGVAVVPKCGGCKCKGCPIPGHHYSFKDEQELLMIRNGLSFDETEGRWVSKYPWNISPDNLPNNYWQCEKILKSTEQKLLKNEEWGDIYKSQINDLLNRNVARKLSKEEIADWPGAFFYLSHLAVKNPRSTSTPVRVVFNSSLKAGKSGISLNACLATGPVAYLNPLHGVLIRFRQFPMCFIGDISKMYHSVGLANLEQHCHRFLWRDLNTSIEPETYVMTRVSMGDVCAGTVATEAMYANVEKFGGPFPEASSAIKHSTYVDDIDHSVNKSPDETLKLVNQIHNLLLKGKFVVKSWWLAGEGRERTPEELSIDYGKLPDVSDADAKLKSSKLGGARVLGQGWLPTSDTLHFECPLNFGHEEAGDSGIINTRLEEFDFRFPLHVTRRLVLQQTARIYDPLGLLAPFILQAKLLLRETWDKELLLGWDSNLPLDIYVRWKEFFRNCYEMEDIYFPRSVQPKHAVGNPQLVIFSDGSELAYGCTIYIRWKLLDGGYFANLLFAKGRVAPLHRTSIPQMELNGAVMACRARKTCLKELDYTFEAIYHLIDSETVLFQISDIAAKYKVYEGHRIGEIQASENLDSWNWVPGEQNIGDVVTRGKTPHQLMNEVNWLHGPNFLTQEFESWPVKNIEQLRAEKGSHTPVGLKKQVELEMFKISTTHTDAIQYHRYSSLGKALRVIAYTLLAARARFRKGRKTIGTHIYEKARLFAIKEAQIEFLQDFIFRNPKCKTGKSIGGKYNKFHALLTSQGVWVVGARSSPDGVGAGTTDLYKLNLPILMPYGHSFTKLLMTQSHIDSGHSGRDRTLQWFQKDYYCLRGSRMASKVTNACMVCAKLSTKTLGQFMGPLPPFKLQPGPLFEFIQVDMFGPYTVRGEVNKRSSGKGWGILFVDMVCRAVHIEFVPDYTTESFLGGLSRFCALRGTPKEAFSDPGSQLGTGNPKDQGPWSATDQQKIMEAGVGKGIHWNFSPADSPHRQGLVESMIKSVKRAAAVVMTQTRLSFSEYTTLFYEVMDIINDRPLSTNGIDPKTGSVLVITPNTLIKGRTNKAAGHRDEFDSRHLPRLSEIDRLVTLFWTKWLTFVKPALLVQKKWDTQVRNLEVGDVVLILKSSKLSREYTLARVNKVFPGQDGKVRSVELVYKRLKKNEQNGLPVYSGSSDIKVSRSVQSLILLVPATVHDAECTPRDSES